MSLHQHLVPPAAALLILAALAYVGFRALGALAGDGESGLARVRKLVRVGLPMTFAVAFAGLGAAGVPALVEAGLGAIVPSLIDSRVDGAATGIVHGFASVLVAVAGYLGCWPAVTRVRDVEMTAVTAARRVLRYGVMFVVSFVLLYQGVMVATTGPWWLTVLVVVAGMAGLTALFPYVVRLMHPTRPPTTDERARVESLAADVDASFHAVRVSELADAETAWIDVRGLPGRRHLHVSDYLLDELDDEALRALVASTGERARRNLLEARFVPLTVILAVAAGLLAADPSFLSIVVVPVAVVGVVVSLLASRRIVFAADAAVAERVGADAFAAALRRCTDLNDADYDYGWLKSFFTGAPSLPRRLAALDVANPDRTRPADRTESEADGDGFDGESADASADRDERAPSGDETEDSSDRSTAVDAWGASRRDGGGRR